jgi:hypothetical protein
MLCSICSNIDVDELIPSPSLLRDGIISGTQHHDTYQDLENAARNGCELCKTIESSLPKTTIQQAKIKRMRKFSIHLKMVLQGNQIAEYQGGTKLLVSCSGDVIANFEAYVARGRMTWPNRSFQSSERSQNQRLRSPH